MNLQNQCFKLRIVAGIILIAGIAQATVIKQKPIHSKSQEPNTVQLQLAESAVLLRSSQNSEVLKKNQTIQLMNLCKVIGQSQVLLLQIRPESDLSLDSKKKTIIQSTLQQAITDLQLACDGQGMASPEQLLKRAWQLTGQVQKRLTKLSRSMTQKEDT